MRRATVAMLALLVFAGGLAAAISTGPETAAAKHRKKTTTVTTTTVPPTTTAPPPTTTAPPPTTTAPPPTGATIQPGQSWQAAYNAAAEGSTLNVAPGNHGRQDITGTKRIIFLGQAGATLSKLYNAAQNVTVDNVDIDGNGAKVTILEEEGVGNVYRNLEIRDNTDIQMVGNHGTGVLYDNVWFHDAVMTTAGEQAGVHMECVYSNAPYSTWRNSRFSNCSVMDLFLTRGDWWGQPNVCCQTVEGNTFEPSRRTNSQGEHFYGFLVHDNADSIDRYRVVGNTFHQPVSLGDSPVVNSVFCGNLESPAGSNKIPASWKAAC